MFIFLSVDRSFNRYRFILLLYKSKNILLVLKGEVIMPEPLVELVQQDVQVYSAPDDFFASFDDDSRARLEQWRAECKDVDDWLSTVDPKLEQEADGTDLPRLKDELCKTRVSTGHSHSPYADAARYGVLPTFD